MMMNNNKTTTSDKENNNDVFRRADDRTQLERIIGLEINVATLNGKVDAYLGAENSALKELQLEVRATHDAQENRMQEYERSFNDVVTALRELTAELKHLAPLRETYEEARSAFKIARWFVENVKTLAFLGVAAYSVLHAPNLIALIKG